ncbi:MAG TPA: tetratricopeptide repeat protein, partial [Candidatus Cloacimonadota bacterium]|nr:tetratricopeptide repeat protein [Candidatus Cloacimonadota bacterium]
MGKLEDIPYEEGMIVAKELHSLIEQYDFNGKDVLLIDLLTSIGVFYGKCSMPQISGEYFSKVLKLADKHSLRAYKVRAESNLAICKAQNGNYHEAIELWKILIENEQDPTLRMNMNNNISVGYGIIGDYHKAINYAFAALEIAKKSIPDADNAKLSPLMNLSTAYEKMGDFDRSLKYVEEALILSRKLGNQRRECECLNNLSMIYNQMEEHELALAKAEEGLVLRKKYFAKPDHAVSYNNIGYILEGMGNLKEALQNYKIAMRLRNQNINVAFSTNTLLNIVSVYIQQNKLSFAL